MPRVEYRGKFDAQWSGTIEAVRGASQRTLFVTTHRRSVRQPDGRTTAPVVYVRLEDAVGAEVAGLDCREELRDATGAVQSIGNVAPFVSGFDGVVKCRVTSSSTDAHFIVNFEVKE